MTPKSAAILFVWWCGGNDVVPLTPLLIFLSAGQLAPLMGLGLQKVLHVDWSPELDKILKILNSIPLSLCFSGHGGLPGLL